MPQKGMHPEDIKAAIRKKGKTLTALSIDLNLHESTVRAALKRPMPRVEPLIAEFIGKKPREIWPDRYDEENNRIYPASYKKKLAQRETRVTAKNNVRNIQEG